MSATPDVLVTGSAGHLGHALMLELSRHGFSPVGIDILRSPHTTHIGSISDRRFVASTLERYPTIQFILHTATLHKPHVDSHPKEAFVDTNVLGTLILLEEAAKTKRIKGFVFSSTTSTFGDALAPLPGQPAAWITETVTPIPKNIYGVTKVAAEDMCRLVHRQSGMPVLVLKISRFFPEPDDSETARQSYNDDNLKVCELMYRRVDIADVVDAHVCAMRSAQSIQWAKYIISAPPPFNNDPTTLADLDGQADKVVQRLLPEQSAAITSRGWRVPDRLDRVYDSSKAVRELEWKPKYTFERSVDQIAKGQDWRSELAVKVGKRGYHAVSTGVYTS